MNPPGTENMLGKRLVFTLCMLAALGAGSAAFGGRTIGSLRYSPVPKWIVPPPKALEAAGPVNAPVRYIYNDRQVRLGPYGTENYTAYRIRILKPEALPMGNVTISWASNGSATVHHMRIVRANRSIDLLKKHRFQVIRRENNLEQSILDGIFTATLQASGLQVGDELEFAATTVQQDTILGDHRFGMQQFPTMAIPGVFRYQLSWPERKTMTWRVTRDLPQPAPTTTDGQTRIMYELRDPGSVIGNDGAPPRYNVRRLFEFTDFKNWEEVSARFARLFAEAAMVPAGSELRAETTRIMAASSDPTEHAQAALRLVQQQIRYVYIGLGDGNYRPASVDTTWQRRFGDCKGKTALLLALLREMKIEAEPVLVNALGDDGLDAHLPNPGVFNHVLVRASIGGRQYWLDGTRTGDMYLDMLPPPSFRWALPVREEGSGLQYLTPQASQRPMSLNFIEIDARAGFDKPAIVKAQSILRGDEAFQVQAEFNAMPAEDAERAVRSYWHRQIRWVEPEEVSWHYEERRKTFAFTLARGEGKPDWNGNANTGRMLEIPAAGFYKPEIRRRPREQDKHAPWLLHFPNFRCYASIIRLPAEDSKWRWAHSAASVNLKLAATSYWRVAALNDGVMRTVMSTRVDRPEITAEEAKGINDYIPIFDDKISRVYQVPATPPRGGGAMREIPPFGDAMDWTGDVPMCARPSPS